MATRSAVLIESMSGRVTLYRHWDGNLAVAGAALARACAAASCAEDIAAALLQQPDGRGGHVYELMDTLRPEDAGDLDHVYFVQYRCGAHGFGRHHCGSGAVVSIGHAERPRLATSNTPCLSWPRHEYALPDFVEAVNQDRRRINALLAQRRRDGDGWALRAADYDMLP